jgi:hypothetical protein
MGMTSFQLKQAFQKEPRKTARVAAQILRDFGYGDLTDDYVLESLNKLTGDAQPKGIIEMFLNGWLENGIE